MKKLGSVLHISSQLNLVVRTNFIPKIGKRTIVTDENRKKVGYIYDVIGSVKKPYILIKPLNRTQDFSCMVGESLYIKEKSNKFKKK